MALNFKKANSTVLVRKDFGACFDFYTEKIGLLPVMGDRNGPWCGFVTDKNEGDDYCFAIFEGKAQSAHKGYVQPVGTMQPDTISLSIPSDNIDEDYKRLKEAGVEFSSEPQTIEDWGMRCVYFRDPEGNLLSLEGEIPG
ncbi:MAG: VOC family protein [Defluviitaleaceae bacterium]|nr:VOC family protein [Defluviitaleaceae bacterium]